MDTFSSAPFLWDAKHAISVRWLPIPNCVRDDCQLEIVLVAIVLIMFGAHMSISFIIKVNIFELLNGHIGAPNSVDFWA